LVAAGLPLTGEEALELSNKLTTMTMKAHVMQNQMVGKHSNS
jgi:hypothetical protein